MPDGSVIGLTLIPGTKKGKGRWNLRFVSPETAKRRDMGLGIYPEITIEQARKRGHEARVLIANGSDPIEVRKRERTSEKAVTTKVTFEVAARKKWEEKVPSWKNGKHRNQWINTLEQYVFPKIGEREVSTLKRSDFADVLRPIWFEKPETASRVRQRCHDVMKWCCANEYIDANPVEMVEDIIGRLPAKSKRLKHHPAMPWRNIRNFVVQMLHGGNDITRRALEFLILTAARSGEVRKATWDEIDFDRKIWTIPSYKMKAKKEHRIPLSSRALEILEKQRNPKAHDSLVFPSPSGRVLTDMAFTSFLRKHKVMSEQPGRIATAHGFRSSFRDWASENAFARDLAEKQLAHQVRDQTEAAYHRTDLLEERRPMMEQWCKEIIAQHLHTLEK